MQEKLLNLQEAALNEIKDTSSIEAVESLRVKYLGKKGEITAILKEMGKLSAEERPVSEVLGGLVSREEKIGTVIEAVYEKFVSEEAGRFAEQFHIAEVVEEKVNQMDVLEVENILMSIMKKELHTVINLGALIGFVIGLLNLLL